MHKLGAVYAQGMLCTQAEAERAEPAPLPAFPLLSGLLAPLPLSLGIFSAAERNPHFGFSFSFFIFLRNLP